METRSKALHYESVHPLRRWLWEKVLRLHLWWKMPGLKGLQGSLVKEAEKIRLMKCAQYAANKMQMRTRGHE
jgi:hypothetical protein